MLTVNDFEKPVDRPWNMLEGYEHAAEKENVLAIILIACIEAGEFVPVNTGYPHLSMVRDGLLIFVPGKGYRLTKKSIGLLYSVYGKEAS